MDPRSNVAKRLTKKLAPRFKTADHLRSLLVLRRFIRFKGAEGASLSEIVKQRVAPTVLQCNECVRVRCPGISAIRRAYASMLRMP